MYAFTLEEIGRCSEAEGYARSGLIKNPRDGWTTHAMAHVFERQGRWSDGLNFMSDNSKLWTTSNLLACHNYWHFSLFHLANDNVDEAIYLLDNEILPRMRSWQSTFSICDASSLLYRLSLKVPPALEKNSLDVRFNAVYSVTQQYLNRHILPFNDVHFMMACLGSGHQKEAADLLATLSSSPYAEAHPQTSSFTGQLMLAMSLAAEGKFARASDVLLSIGDSIQKIGGSDAQRDVFHQLLLSSLSQSNESSHREKLEQLIH